MVVEVPPEICCVCVLLISLTLSFSKKSKVQRWEYRSGRFQTPKVNQLEECLIQSDEKFYNDGGHVELI